MIPIIIMTIENDNDREFMVLRLPFFVSDKKREGAGKGIPQNPSTKTVGFRRPDFPQVQ